MSTEDIKFTCHIRLVLIVISMSFVKQFFFYFSMQSTVDHIMSNKFLQTFKKISFRDTSYHVCAKANYVCDIMNVTLSILIL